MQKKRTRAVPWLMLILVLIVEPLAHGQGKNGKKPSKGAWSGFHLNLMWDFGRSQSSAPQDLPEDWPARFQPPGGGMRTEARTRQATR